VPANSFAYHKGIAHVWKSRQTFWWIERIYTIYSYGQQVFMVWKTMYNSQGNNNCIPLIIFLTIVYCPTPTCKPNSASVGWSRSWLCFPTEEEEEPSPREGMTLDVWTLLAVLWVSGGCLDIVWRVSGRCLTGVWRVSGGWLKDVWKVPEGSLKGVWRFSMGCPNPNLVSQG